MDDQILLEGFRAERADRDPRARAAAWSSLEERIEDASLRVENPTRVPRRGVLAALGGAATAAVVAAVLLISSGSTAEPATGQVLGETADAAASGADAPDVLAGAGQYYFVKTKKVELTGWYPGSYSVPGSPTTRKGGLSALIPTESEYWLAPSGGGRFRETMGTPEFLSSAEQTRWEQEGSPLPAGFEPRYDRAVEEEIAENAGPEEQRLEAERHVLEMRRGVRDYETPARPIEGEPMLSDLSSAPTIAAALRQAVEQGGLSGLASGTSRTGGPLDTEATIGELADLLTRPNASPALRAAAFDALSEIPGVELDRDATDLLGREGMAVRWKRPIGMESEYIFDPTTSRSLGERTVLADPTQDPVLWSGYEAGFITRDVAFLASAVVDSTR